MKNCNCGNNEFITTLTVNYEVTVKATPEGLVDGDAWEKADFQPDEPYGDLSCTICGHTHTLADLEEL